MRPLRPFREGLDETTWISLGFLEQPVLRQKRPIMPIGFSWISLDFLVLNETYQWVTLDFLPKIFRRPCLGRETEKACGRHHSEGWDCS
jgi:hypothetical protein